MDVLKHPKRIYQKMCSKNVASNLELARQLDTLYSKISDTSTVTELIYIVSACCRTELSGVCNPSSQGFLLQFFKILCQQKCQSLLLYFHSNHPIIQWKIWSNTTECLSDYWRITPSSFRQPLWYFPVSRNFAFKSSTNLPLSTMAAHGCTAEPKFDPNFLPGAETGPGNREVLSLVFGKTPLVFFQMQR